MGGMVKKPPMQGYAKGGKVSKVKPAGSGRGIKTCKVC
jgi:hypothetical protein